jgi:hypothetical protein
MRKQSSGKNRRINAFVEDQYRWHRRVFISLLATKSHLETKSGVLAANNKRVTR